MKRFNHLALFPALVFVLIGFFVMPATPALASGAVHRGIEGVERSGAFLRDVTYDFVDVTFLGGASLAETGGDILSGLRTTTYSFVDATMNGLGLIGSSLSEIGYASHNFSKLFHATVSQEAKRASVVALASGIEAFNHLSFGFELVVGSIEDVRRSTERTGYEFGQTIGQGFLALGVYPEEIWDLSTRIAQNNPVLDGVNLIVPQFKDDHDEYQPPPLKLMANASSALDSWWGTIINGVDTAITRVVDFFSDSDTTIVEAPVPVAPTASVLPQPTTPVVTTFAPAPPSTPVSTNVYTTNQYVTSSGGGISNYDLMFAINGLRAELAPQIKRAMNSPRSNFNASSGDDDDVDLSGYLELIGGTLTGTLGGTDATFSGDITSNTLEVVASTTFNGVEYLFPSLDGSDNYVLTTDGNGGLTWEAGAVGGITSLGGLGVASQTFATSSDANIGLSIVSSGSTHTFTPTWIGTLASDRGGTGTSTVNANELLIGNAGGTAWTTIATSSLGFATSADLSNYLTLAAWFATTTDALDEGLVNLYYDDAYVADYISASTTIANAVPTDGNILLGNGSNWLSVATTSLGFVDTDTNYFTDAGSYLFATNGESLRAEFFTATSTTATSTFAGGLSVAGSTGLTVLQNGNVGIGTSSPGTKLSVWATDAGTTNVMYPLWLNHDTSGSPASGFGTGILFNGRRSDGYEASIATISAVWTSASAGSEDGDILFSPVLNSNAFERLRITSAGNVGIGTTSPSQKLHVEGNARITGALYDGANSAGSNGSLLQSTGTGFAWVATSTLGISHSSLTGLTTGDPHTQYALLAGRSGGQTLYGGTAASQELTLDSTSHATKGVVNINSPVLQTYTVAAGNDNYFRNLSSGASAQSAVRASANVASGGIIARGSSNGFNVFGVSQNSLVNFAATAGSGLNIGTTNSAAVGIGANNALQMIFDTSGNVGVGTTWGSTAEEKLSVSGDMWTNGNLIFEGATANSFETNITATDPTADRTLTLPNLSGTFIISDSVTGNVGIGTTTGNYKLTVVGTAAMTGLVTGSGDAVCINPSTGELQYNSGADTCLASSLRFKHDVEDLALNLSDLKQLRAVSYKENGTNEERVGFIAEEVEDVDPRLMFYESNGTTPRGVRYEDIVALIVKSVQELDAKITLLTNRFAAAVVTFTELVSDKMTTKELCLEDVCITKSELQQLLDEAHIDAPSSEDDDVPLVEEPPVEEPPTEEPPAEEPPTEEPPVEEPPTEEPPIEEPPAEEVPVEELPVEEPPVVDEPVVETPEEPLVEEGA